MPEPKWPVYKISRNYYTGPNRRKVIAVAKVHSFSTQELREFGVVEVVGKELTQKLVDDAGEPVKETLNSLRAQAQAAGEPRFICVEGD